MSTLQEQFDAAAIQAKAFTSSPSQDDLLKLYGLFKQATIGDNTTAAPGMFDPKGKYKWNAWTALKGTDSEVAKKQYVDFVAELAVKHK
ncbi:hypothetical protein BGX26_005384 [Mortierella sp. AD094]|nr:hypothetical protein BGX26_005384 [Mortierella sp. AD094]